MILPQRICVTMVGKTELRVKSIVWDRSNFGIA